MQAPRPANASGRAAGKECIGYAVLPHFGKCKRRELVDLASRANGKRKLVNIDGDQDEECLLRRFFEAFQQSIGGFSVQPIGGIEDEDFISAFERLQVKHVQHITDLRNFYLCGFVFYGNASDIWMDSGIDLSATRALIAEIGGSIL